MSDGDENIIQQASALFLKPAARWDNNCK